jgi:Xaa-Pro aminopeptidase
VPGEKLNFSRWSEQEAGHRKLLRKSRTIAMQHSPNCAIPYIAMVDGGTLELVQSIGVEVRSSADLVQIFEARWSAEQLDSHLEAGRRMDSLRAEAFDLIRDRLRDGARINEWEVKRFLLKRFDQLGMVTDHGPIVAANANASDPHYEPDGNRHADLGNGDLILIDMWAKLNTPEAVYYDITWTGFAGRTAPDEMVNIFEIVAEARDRGIEAVRSGKVFRGFEVDDVVRGFIEDRGYGEYYIHRTGHSIGTEVHGAGANMDNFETHDERRILPRTCFSIEPGIYLPKFGIRSEVNMWTGDGTARVTGEIQRELVILN